MRDSIYKFTLDMHEVASQVQIRAKENDSSRKIIVTLMENGKPYTIESGCIAVFMMKKPDGTVLLNDCDIIDSGSAIQYEFTSQTTASEGLCECELRVVDSDETVITSPRFTILVSENVYDDGQVESESEFTTLTNALAQLDDIRDLVDDAEDYADSASASATAAGNYKTEALQYKNATYDAKQEVAADKAAVSAIAVTVNEKSALAVSSATSASGSATNALASELAAQGYATSAESSASSASASASSASGSASSASQSASSASTSATNAGTSESNASTSESNASASATSAYGYEQSAKNYKEICEQIASSLQGGFIPMGTITFANLPTNATSGWMYNISDSFVSDSRFKDGGGKTYPDGTNVYLTADNKWDCLSGSIPVINGKVGNSITLDGSDIAVTGYQKATSQSAIAVTDSINVALGKLEKKADDTKTSLTDYATKTELNASSVKLVSTSEWNALTDIQKNEGNYVVSSDLDNAIYSVTFSYGMTITSDYPFCIVRMRGINQGNNIWLYWWKNNASYSWERTDGRSGESTVSGHYYNGGTTYTSLSSPSTYALHMTETEANAYFSSPISGVLYSHNVSVGDLSLYATTSEVNAKYTKPSGGIPGTDLASDVQTALGKWGGYSVWTGAEADKGTDANTIYICTS